MSEVENRITYHDHQLLVFSLKDPSQRIIVCLDHDAFPHPLPELLLCGPKLFAVAADYERRFLLFPFLLLFLCAHLHRSL